MVIIEALMEIVNMWDNLRGREIAPMQDVGRDMNPVMKKHLELEIKTLQNAPRDEDTLERLLRLKEREKSSVME
jgi:hypothetical protein